jgi:hypothetical protein
MRSLMSTLALMACLALAPLASIVTSAEATDSDAAVALAKETLARKMRTDSEAFELVSIAASQIRLAGSALSCEPPPTEKEAPVAAGWRVRLRQGKDTFDLVVAEGRVRTCKIQTGERSAPARRTIEQGLAPMVDVAREDLARRLSIRTETVKVVEAVSVVWRDSSAGCPQKGMAYTQVLTPGVRIRLNVPGRPYLYHAREGGTPFLCVSPSGTEPLPPERS